MTDWKENIRDKMSEYSEAAPEGLLEDIMVSIDKENRRRRSVVITISSLAAAAIAAVAVFMPDTRDRIENVPAVRTALSGGTDIIRIENIPHAGTIGSRKTAMTSETEGNIAGGREETPAAADSIAGKKDVVLTDNDAVGNGNDADKEEGIAGGREENGNTGMTDRYGWKDLLIAEAARPEKDRKIRMNLYAAGFAGSGSSYGGYSHDVAAMAAEAPMTYGENALAGILMVARLGASQPSIGTNWPMNSIAASVIGGLALTGGVGNPAGALVGAAIIMLIQNMIVLYGVNVYWQTAVSGIVVVLAISIDSVTTILAESRRRKAYLAKHRAQIQEVIHK